MKEKMRFADTHCHLNFSVFDRSRKRLLAACLQANIELIVVPGTQYHDWELINQLCQNGKHLKPAFGLHPYFIKNHEEWHLEELDNYLARCAGLVVGVGEVGLDYFVGDIERQQYFFEAQLSLASKHALPVIIHSRKAHNQIIKTIKKYDLIGGVVHAFSGSEQELSQFSALGLKIGVGGVITWPKSIKTRKAIKNAPLSCLVLETDSPDMPVAGQSKGESTPLNILRIFESLCEIRTESPQELAAALWQNSLALYQCGEQGNEQ